MHTIRALYPCFVRKSAFFSPTQNTSGQGLASPARGGPVTQQGPAAPAGRAPPHASPGKSRRRGNQFARRVLGRLRWNLYQFQEEIKESVAYWADFEFSPGGALRATARVGSVWEEDMFCVNVARPARRDVWSSRIVLNKKSAQYKPRGLISS